MDSENTTIIELGVEGCVCIVPCDCCTHTRIAISTSTCILRIEGVDPDELVSFAEALLEAAEMQSSKEDFADWN